MIVSAGGGMYSIGTMDDMPRAYINIGSYINFCLLFSRVAYDTPILSVSVPMRTVAENMNASFILFLIAFVVVYFTSYKQLKCLFIIMCVWCTG